MKGGTWRKPAKRRVSKSKLSIVYFVVVIIVSCDPAPLPCKLHDVLRIKLHGSDKFSPLEVFAFDDNY